MERAPKRAWAELHSSLKTNQEFFFPSKQWRGTRGGYRKVLVCFDFVGVSARIQSRRHGTMVPSIRASSLAGKLSVQIEIRKRAAGAQCNTSSLAAGCTKVFQ